MLKSMTGFGKAVREMEGKTVTIEIKCLNSKQADIYVKIPAAYREGENDVRNEVSRILIRGKIETSVWIETNAVERSAVINPAVVLDYLEQFKQLEPRINLPGNEVMLPVIMRFPDVLKQEKQGFDEEEWQQIMETIRQAIVQADEFRVREGQSISSDFKERVKLILNGIDRIRMIEKNRIIRLRERIGQSLNEISERIKVDENRFEQELIYYIEKLDINEEMVRLTNHCHFFLETMDQDDTPGRKLGFISQEIGREINTIGSKANDSEIQRIVVEMKDELEKLKEQCLNVL